MVPEPSSSSPPPPPRRKPSFALGGFPVSTPLAESPDPFSFRQPALETAYANPWQNLFAQSGAPTPSVLPPDSPFAPVNAVGPGFPGGNGRRGSLGHPGVASGFSNLSIGSPGRHQPAREETELMGPPTSFPLQQPGSGQALWPPGSSSSLPQPPTPPAFKHPSLSKDENGRLLGGPLGGSGRKASSPLPPASRLKAIYPVQIPSPIPPTWLVLDLRTHNLFTQSRIPSAIPITIPSTLLRRPNFTIAKVLPMLASDNDRARLQQYKSGPEVVSTILVYDQDGLTSQEGGVLQGLLNKFDKDGFKGELCLVKGGFQGVVKAGVFGQVETSLIAHSGESTGKAVNGRDLPIEAFQQGSVNAFGGRQTGTDVKMGSRSATSGSVTATTNPSFNSHPRAPNSQTTPATQTQAANPFFDNIRQNAELAQGITERIPLDLSSSTVDRARDLPSWLRDLVTASPGEASEILAMQFYKIELGEQRRLQGIMDHHTRNPGDAIMESGSDSDGMKRGGTTPGGLGKSSEGGEDYFPYSITAGLEKGGKNRFKNIWPFDHARVRLNEPSFDDGSDYINASFIQPRATNKRYIATQGPLPSTFRDFWTLCWEQNVRVIVMLTKQHEGGQIKCGDYWSDQTYGPMKLHPLGVEGGVDEVPKQEGGGFFFSATAAPPAPVPGARATIKRSFQLTHADYPDEPARLVTQIQYVSWPDFDIPEQPSDLLNLIHEVNELHDSAIAEAHADGAKEIGPVVVHCSAGVGRTGSYVIVDAVLDAMKREMLSKREVLAKRSFDRRAAGGASDEAQQKPPKRIHTPPVFGSTTSETPGTIASSPTSLDQFPGLAPRSTSFESASTGSSVGSSSYPNHSNLFPPPSGINGGGSLSPEPDANPSFPFSNATAPHAVVSAFNFNSINIQEQRSRTPSFSSIGPSASHSNAPSLTTSASVASSSRAFSRESSPQGPDSQRHAPSTEDGFAAPRRQHRGGKDALPASAPTPLGEMSEPIRAILEDMRQQRMSLCQTLRQYVFAYRVVIQGILDMVDEDRGRDSSYDSHDDHKKRQASPTDLQSTLSKRPSIKLPKVRPRRTSKASGTSLPGGNGGPSTSTHHPLSSELESIPASATSQVDPQQQQQLGLDGGQQ